MLRELHAQTDPFRFIIYSEWAGASLPPVALPSAQPVESSRSAAR